MIEIELDGKKVDIVEGSMIMHAADKAGTYIPHFCYHKKLSIAASCRMCLVDVEKNAQAHASVCHARYARHDRSHQE
jgi:NADH-quinone oxidoreductase subunit G